MKSFSKNLQIAILSVLSLFVAVGSVPAQTRGEQSVYAKAQRITKDDFPFSTQTAQGARIYAVGEPSDAMLAAIDRGLSDLFAVARRNNYRMKLNYSDYVVFIARPDRQKDGSRYSPDIAVPLGQYAGSVYDQGGFVYAAGVVLGYNPCAFVIGEHQQDFDRVAEVVRYEGEHIVLYHNDRQLYRETADHSQGGGHPILQ